jgi:hypothetical protein
VLETNDEKVSYGFSLWSAVRMGLVVHSEASEIRIY